MYSADPDQEELEDDLYQEDERDSEGSELNSELEFHLYSQLHYSSNPGELEDREEEEEEDTQQQGVFGKCTDKDSDLEVLKSKKPLSSPNARLKQHPKIKKAEKQKKTKSEPKNQKLSSSHFEEVIVIDSSPEVISISENDTADDDVGICALKGQSSHLLQTSTPMQQETQKRKRSPAVPVTLVSSSSDSDSERDSNSSESESSESSESSDSDGLENWMMLGGGKHDGDQSISLNLEGEPDGSTDAEEEEESWLVSKKDKEAQIYNKGKGLRLPAQRISNRYYTGKNVHCRNCNRTGHLSKNCPDPKKLSPCFLCGTNGHISSECSGKHCNNCGLPGHLYDSCSERAYWHKQCHRCNRTGHFFDACPEIWRQYHITTKTGPPVKKKGKDVSQSPAYCYNCSQKGHFGHDCTRQRMFKGVYPSTPFISYYDSVEDINSRKHRIRLRVKGMRKNGYLPTPPQTPVTPGPPKKKQKINHHKNNHQLYHQNSKTSTNHNPSPSHIFFDDKFRDSTPKTKRFKQQDGVGSVKPWKPKRPVPTSRDPLPPTKLILDEADDFPRGGGPEENVKKKKKKNKMKNVPLSLPVGHLYTGSDLQYWNGRKHGPASKHQKGDKKKNWKKYPQKGANKKLKSQMYPKDENLFIIKQRKRSR